MSRDFDANFATEVHASAKTGKPTLENSRDGNLVTGDNAPADQRSSGSRTGVQNEKGDEEGPQEEQQQQGQQPLHRNVIGTVQTPSPPDDESKHPNVHGRCMPPTSN